jgi:hypothetical protein
MKGERREKKDGPKFPRNIIKKKHTAYPKATS